MLSVAKVAVTRFKGQSLSSLWSEVAQVVPEEASARTPECGETTCGQGTELARGMGDEVQCFSVGTFDPSRVAACGLGGWCLMEILSPRLGFLALNARFKFVPDQALVPVWLHMTVAYILRPEITALRLTNRRAHYGMPFVSSLGF